MAIKKKIAKRPARAGAPVSDSDENDVDSSTEFEDESDFAEEEEVELEVVTRRLVAPRVQGIVKTILAGIDEMTIVVFFSKVPEAEVCTVDTTNTEDESVKITVHPHPWAAELAGLIWDEIDVDALDPNTVNVETDGWVCTYPMEF